MNPEVKQKWVNALRSGDYVQTDGMLRYNNSFCCLGVLCDIYGKTHTNVSWERVSDDVDFFEYTFDGNNQVLPKSVIEWAGVNSFDPSVHYYDEDGEKKESTLIDMNDSSFSFEEIADAIEKSL